MRFWTALAVLTAAGCAYLTVTVTDHVFIATATGLLAGAAVIACGALCCIAGEEDS